MTRGLSDAGATVVVPARHPDQARKVLGGVAGVEIAELDLADLGSVERFAGDFLASDRGVDMLINNAAVMANELTRVGPDGWESQFAIDHLGHFALTNRLWPALARGGLSRHGHGQAAGTTTARPDRKDMPQGNKPSASLR